MDLRQAARALGRLLRLPVAPPPPRPGLGAAGGRLAPCTEPGGCVSSVGARAGRLPPLPGQGGRDASLAGVAAAVGAERGGRVVERGPGYLRAEFTTSLWRFVDDAEFLWDPRQEVVHFRAASRVGRSDLGANGRRIERIRSRLARQVRT